MLASFWNRVRLGLALARLMDASLHASWPLAQVIVLNVFFRRGNDIASKEFEGFASSAFLGND